MIKKVFITITIATFILVTCKTNETDYKTSTTIAKVNDYSLFKDDIYIPENTVDTSSYIKIFIDKWIEDKLIYNEAQNNLSKQTKDELIELVNDYKNQLYSNAYKELYIKQNIDTNISNKEINKFYNENIGQYKLSENIVKAIYIKVPLNAPKVYKLRNWLKSDKPKDLEKLNTYCTQYSDKFDDFSGNWISFNEVLKFFPKKIKNQNSILQYKKLLETRDSTFRYYIEISDYKLSNDTTPIIFMKNEIIDNILKIRKRELIKVMKQNLYEDAKSKNKIEYFN